MSSSVQIAATPLMDRLIARTVRMRSPLSVHFDLTYRCNERCVHCYLDHQDHGELTTQECTEILEQLAKAGTLFLTFSGGEIFLRKDLEQLLAVARRLQFDISLKTNALLVTRERAEMLQRHSVRRVQISVYSSEAAIHDAITKVPGSLERSLAAVPLLRERGIQVKLACPLMKQNLMAYRGVMALAERIGVPYVLDLTITPMMDGTHSPLEHRVSVDALLPVLQDSALQSCGTKIVPEDGFAPAVLGSGVSSGIESSAYDAGKMLPRWNEYGMFAKASCRSVPSARSALTVSAARGSRGWKVEICLVRTNEPAPWPSRRPGSLEWPRQ